MPAPETSPVDATAYAKAILNILEDVGEEKTQLRDTQNAILNVLEDAAAEKETLQAHQKAILNILGDFSDEKVRLADVQRALLNILDDFEVEKHRVEKAEELFRKLIESAPDAMVIVDRGGRIMLVNVQTERFFGYRSDELVGQPVEVLVPERFRMRHVEYRAGYLDAPLPRPMGSGRDLYGRRQDGTEFPVEISLSPLETPEGLIVLSSIRDISQRRAAEEGRRQAIADLARSNAELEQFAYVASHDLQEPLRMVSAYVQLFEKRYKGQIDERADKYIHYAVDGAKRMESLIGALLDYSRAGRAELQLQPIATATVLHRVLGTLQQVIDESHATVTHDALPVIRSDETQLARVFQNLVSNALKFRRPGVVPHVHVAAERKGDTFVFSVCDNGIGIDSAYADRIFVIFQRLHARSEFPGTGIGLAICKKVIERLGGKIWFESEVGKGTTFFFTLPAGEEVTR